MTKDRDEADKPSGQHRMTLGEHLEELRGCVVRGVIAIVLAALICIWPAKYLLEILVRPLMLALRSHDQPTSLLQTSPVEAILVYIKVVIIFALIISGPYVVYQLWHFVAVGLFPREKAWVFRLVPTSIGLFLTGVLFMYVFALLVSLNFLIGFGNWLPMPKAQPNLLERKLLGVDKEKLTTTQPAIQEWPTIPIVMDDPNDPPNGALWFSLLENRLKVRRQDETYSYPFQRDDRRSLITTHFKIGEYLSFVLILTIAFGLAFQMPLVVIFLVRSGIVPVETFRKYRKLVILGIVFIAGMLAPPDLLSHIMLSGPMIVLFEIGLRIADRKTTEQSESAVDAGE